MLRAGCRWESIYKAEGDKYMAKISLLWQTICYLLPAMPAWCKEHRQSSAVINCTHEGPQIQPGAG